MALIGKLAFLCAIFVFPVDLFEGAIEEIRTGRTEAHTRVEDSGPHQVDQ